MTHFEMVMFLLCLLSVGVVGTFIAEVLVLRTLIDIYIMLKTARDNANRYRY